MTDQIIAIKGWRGDSAVTDTTMTGHTMFPINLKQNEAQSARAESTHKGVNYRSKYVTQVQQRPESPTVNLTWHARKHRVHNFHQRYILCISGVPVVEFMYLVFTRMPVESYRRRLRSLLYLCYVFLVLINSFVCWLCSQWVWKNATGVMMASPITSIRDQTK